MKLGFIQPAYPATASNGDSAATVEFIFRELERNPCELVVLPEYANVPGMSDPAEMLARAGAGAETLRTRGAAAARRRRGAVAVNVLQRLAARPVNVTWLFDDRGETVGSYIKTHLSAFERDTLRLAAGEEHPYQRTRTGWTRCAPNPGTGGQTWIAERYLHRRQ